MAGIKLSRKVMKRSSEQGHTEAARAPEDDEGRSELRKAVGSRKQTPNHGSPNGATHSESYRYIAA